MSRVPKCWAGLAVASLLVLGGCSASDSSNDEVDGTTDQSAAASDDTSSGANAGNGSDPTTGSADEDSGSGSEHGDDGADNGDDGGGESGESEAPPVDSGPCEAVVPLQDVAELLHDPGPGELSSGGDVINSCLWTSADGATLVVEAQDAHANSTTGVDPAFRDHPVANLGEEAGSVLRKKDSTAELQVYALVKGSGKALPVLFHLTWTGDGASVKPLVGLAKPIV